MIGHRQIILVILVCCCVNSLFSQTPNPKEVDAKGTTSVQATATPSEAMAAAARLFEARKFRDAVKAYEALTAENPTSIPARMGLIRSYLKAGEVKKALEYVTDSRGAYPDSNDLKVAMGEVLFRRGEIGAAEKIFTSAWINDDNNVQAMLGLARIYDAMSLHKRAYLMKKAAYERAPNDPEVASRWATVEALATRDERKHRCELVSNIDSTETELKPLMHDVQNVRGWGLEVTINSKKTKLLLDTGASGIMVSRSQAEKAGIKKLSTVYHAGIGDKGPAPGYEGFAESIDVGALKFRDCKVNVVERRNVVENDGLIGADVFKDYLVNIDFPGKKLKLSPLPIRPDEERMVATLDTSGDTATENSSASVGLPRDRYIAPEMSTWTPVYRFGHRLLIPTKVNGGAPRLFLIDTGAFTTTFSTELAREITKVSRDHSLIVKGVSGSVAKVYQAESATLEFGRLKQRNEDVVTIDLSGVGFDAGTEVSGLLGSSVLVLLEVKIDYRDGLVDFVYDAKRTHTEYLRR